MSLPALSFPLAPSAGAGYGIASSVINIVGVDQLELCLCGHPVADHAGKNLCRVVACGCRGFRQDHAPPIEARMRSDRRLPSEKLPAGWDS